VGREELSTGSIANEEQRSSRDLESCPHEVSPSEMVPSSANNEEDKEELPSDARKQKVSTYHYGLGRFVLSESSCSGHDLNLVKLRTVDEDQTIIGFFQDHPVIFNIKTHGIDNFEKKRST
jgi:hypothetical protein